MSAGNIIIEYVGVKKHLFEEKIKFKIQNVLIREENRNVICT